MAAQDWPRLQHFVLAAGAVAATATAIAAYGMIGAESQIFGRSLVAPPSPKQLALTFDDGPNPAVTPRLLEVLARHDARATFFLIGDFVLRQPELTRRIQQAGHVIGNHTMHHAFLPRHTLATIRAEMLDCNHALEDTLGASVKLFRAPHGGRRPAVFRIARELDLEVVQWNLIVGDWMKRTPEDLLRRIERGVARNRRRARGTNLVLHDGSQHGLNADCHATVEAVAALLERAAKDFDLVTPPYWR